MKGTIIHSDLQRGFIRAEVTTYARSLSSITGGQGSGHARGVYRFHTDNFCVGHKPFDNS